MGNVYISNVLSTSNWFRIVQLIFISALLIRVICLYWKWRYFMSLVNKLPMWKLRFYHFLGHAQFAIYIRMLRTPLSPRTYDFILLNGYSLLVKKKGISVLMAASHPVVLFSQADSVEVLLNHSTELEKAWPYKFTHPWLGRGLLTSYGAKWKTRRRLLTPAFHFNILNDFLLVFNAQAKVFADILSKHTVDEFVDIVPYVTRCSLDIICESLLGVEMHVQTKPSSPYAKSVHFLTAAISERMVNILIWPDIFFKISPLGRKFAQNTKIVRDFTYKLIKEKKETLMIDSKPGTSGECKEEVPKRKKLAFLDLLLDEHVKNETLSEADIIEEVDTFTFEGHDTTAMAISFALYLIGLHPSVQRKIHQELDSIFGENDRDATMDDLKEMKYLECVFKESLRLFPSVPLFGRRLNEDIEIQGYIVPKSSTCIVHTYMLHRDPDIFPNPEKFDPDRFNPGNCSGRHPFGYVPFSAGSRNCIGQKFAVMEEKVVISTILRKFQIRSLDPRDKVNLLNDLVLRPVDRLRLEIRHRDFVPEKPPVYYYP